MLKCNQSLHIGKAIKLRHLRRSLNKQMEPYLRETATQQFIRSTFRPKPRWMPMFAWKLVVNLVVKH
jgi:hypothetical protein